MALILFNSYLSIFIRRTFERKNFEMVQFDQIFERFLRDHFRHSINVDFKKNSSLDLPEGENDILILKEDDKNVCFYSSISNFLNCFGGNETFACKVESRLDSLNTTSIKLTNLEMIEENNILKLVEKGSKFTMVIPETNTQVLITLKNVDDFSGPGILIESDECWSNLKYFLERFYQVDFRLSIYF